MSDAGEGQGEKSRENVLKSLQNVCPRSVLGCTDTMQIKSCILVLLFLRSVFIEEEKEGQREPGMNSSGSQTLLSPPGCIVLQSQREECGLCGHHDFNLQGSMSLPQGW